MRQSFKVSFYLRSNYENKEGKSPVMLRVFLNGEMANFGSTKIFVDKSLWNNTTSRLKGRTAEALSANAALDSISTMLNNIYHKFEDDESLSLDKIRLFFVGKDREYTTFLPIFDKFNEDVRLRVGHTISKDSLQKYSVLRRHFEEFLIYKYGKKDIGLAEFTPSVVQDFELYLSTVAGCAYNTSVKKMKALKTVTIYAQKRGYLLHDPFLNHRFHRQRCLAEEPLSPVLARRRPRRTPPQVGEASQRPICPQQWSARSRGLLGYERCCEARCDQNHFDEGRRHGSRGL